MKLKIMLKMINLYGCLKTNDNTGFMHESFNKDDPSEFSRRWFAWANTLFGELILKVYRTKPHLLNSLKLIRK
jgi:meiotically up-regulated gene 157 (Mug157) protein